MLVDMKGKSRVALKGVNKRETALTGIQLTPKCSRLITGQIVPLPLILRAGVVNHLSAPLSIHVVWFVWFIPVVVFHGRAV